MAKEGKKKKIKEREREKAPEWRETDLNIWALFQHVLAV